MLNRLPICSTASTVKSQLPLYLAYYTFAPTRFSNGHLHTHKHSHWFDALTASASASAIVVCCTQLKSTRVFGFRTLLLLMTLLSTIRLLTYVLCCVLTVAITRYAVNELQSDSYEFVSLLFACTCPFHLCIIHVNCCYNCLNIYYVYYI